MSSWNRNHGLVESHGLTGQYGSESPRMTAVQAMATPASAWQTASAMRGRGAPREDRAEAAADAESGQEHGEDDREGVGRRAEHQRQHAGPDHFGSKRAQARERNRHVDGWSAVTRLVEPDGHRGIRRVRGSPVEAASRKPSSPIAEIDRHRRRTWRSPCRRRAADRSRRAGSRRPRRRCWRRRRSRATRRPGRSGQSSARWPAASPPSASSAAAGRRRTAAPRSSIPGNPCATLEA